MNTIKCENLSKSYGKFYALNSLNLDINKGEIFGFLGPNGAGKTTTIQLLMGILTPTKGKAFINELDCHLDRVAVKSMVGYLPDNPIFHDYLRGSEILTFIGKMHGIENPELKTKVSSLLEQFYLLDAANEFAVNYSLGMKKKLALACAYIHEPEVYILDEPTAGLDPKAAKEIQTWIIESSKSEKTIFLSTHQLTMAEKLCHRVGIIDKGQLKRVESIKEMKEKNPGYSLEEVFFSEIETINLDQEMN